jgi:hypothetical protein
MSTPTSKSLPHKPHCWSQVIQSLAVAVVLTPLICCPLMKTSCLCPCALLCAGLPLTTCLAATAALSARHLRGALFLMMSALVR